MPTKTDIYAQKIMRNTNVSSEEAHKEAVKVAERVHKNEKRDKR
jgi:hypothetical protein